MNKLSNPFTPGAGFLPPELAGREQVIEDGRVVAARTKLLRAERGLMLIGSRGVGKTSLLKWLAEDARQTGVIPSVSDGTWPAFPSDHLVKNRDKLSR